MHKISSRPTQFNLAYTKNISMANNLENKYTNTINKSVKYC